jgi:hypothetical protein
MVTEYLKMPPEAVSIAALLELDEDNEAFKVHLDP